MQIKQTSRMTRELFDKLSVAFRPRPVSPDLSHDVIMYEAGAAAVLAWLENELNATTSTATVQGAGTVAPVNDHEVFTRIISGGQP